MMRGLMLIGLAGALAAPAHGDQHGDALAWLQKMAAAAQGLNYTGTFTYQSGGSSETSRITHIVDASGEQERLEVLDGSPREVVRRNEEVRCFLPDEKVVIIERRGEHKAFPALLPASVSNLDEHYRLRKGETARVAGFDSQLIILEPKDALRYGHQIWADLNTGLILKARMVSEGNETIEQFAFSQLQINGVIDPGSLRSRFDTEGRAWRIHNARAAQRLSVGGDWLFKAQLPGFRKSAGMRRGNVSGGIGETTHFVFTDGLASISVFIEPLGDRKAAQSTYSVGAINVYERVAGKHRLTVLGEVPMASLKRLGDGIEPRKK
ncbi:MAG: Sigma factor AlgU regulatory protein MucB [Rhodocyclaceae bacterium]|nr:Sigma factor AlgU regulatory protein MucB [Rhodocyclaceae bacterium]CAG0927009.1 Sigma factor AlgU regulatory protein MucB [Rhodocyclaceae bacterium]